MQARVAQTQRTLCLVKRPRPCGEALLGLEELRLTMADGLFPPLELGEELERVPRRLKTWNLL